MSTFTRHHKLRALLDLLTTTCETIIQEWEKEESQGSPLPDEKEPALPSWKLYNAQRTIVATCGAFTELVHDPRIRLMEVSAQFVESRALHIASEHRIADIIVSMGGDGKDGVSIDDIAAKVGINALKLGRVMRVLTSAHIFEEVKEDHFANNRVSACMIHNEQLRTYFMMLGTDTYFGASRLPDVLRDPATTHSTSLRDAPICKAVHTDLSYWEWLETDVELPDGTMGPNPSLERFSVAMAGNGGIMARPSDSDFPWSSLGSGVVVDVGGGVGSMSLELSRIYPDLHFVVQDRAPLIEQANAMWTTEYPEALSSRVTLMAHDFFMENSVKGADAYMLRYIVHGWHDTECVAILKAIRASMAPHSRILVIDQVMNSAVGCEGLASAPDPLPADYGVHSRMVRAIDMIVLTHVNGVERDLAQLRLLASSAGLEVVKVWETRGTLAVVEMRLPDKRKNRAMSSLE